MRSSPRGLRPGGGDYRCFLPGNELHPGKLPAKLIDTLKEAFAEYREGFPDFSVVEDVMGAELVL
jgi:hypothetical protein